MINKNKKGQISNIIGYILLFSLIAVLYVFSSYFIFSMGNDYIVYNLVDIGQNVNFSEKINTGFQTLGVNYQDTNLDIIDNGFLLSYLILIISSLIVAYRSRGLNYFGFLNIMTYGLMFLLFLLGIIGVIVKWIYTDWLLALFTNLSINLPLFAFYINNLYIISLLHLVVLFLIMVIDLDFTSINTRKKNERMSLNQMDDELI